MMAVLTLRTTLALALAATVSLADDVPSGAVSSFVAPAGFPTSVFSSYWEKPVSTQEPQPKIYDPILRETFPFNLTDPNNIPQEDPDPIHFPKPTVNLTPAQQRAVIAELIGNVSAIITADNGASNCTKCKESLVYIQEAARQAPKLLPDAFVELCTTFKLHSNETCEEDFEATTFGAIWTQVAAFADVKGLDGNWICHSISSTFCPTPSTSPLDTKNLFPKPKPKHAKKPKASGKRVKVLHLSDFHIDPRYAAGSEANCTSGLCCRVNNDNTALPTGQISLASPLYGAYKCDTPYDLGLAALQAIGPLTGTSKKHPFAWTLYTGDLVSHDSQNQLSRAYTEYAEYSIYSLFKRYITGPVFATLGNHDSNPEAIDAPHSLPGPLGQQLSWNYNHVASLWRHEGWIDAQAAATARTHYGAYSIRNHYGLRHITFNSDFWYRSNFLNYINTTNPDVSGSLKFVIDELQEAEDCGEKVWIHAHVLSGWDGSNPLPNPTNLFYQIIDRYSPHVIQNVFFGHTHEDQVFLYYANNGTVQNAKEVLTPAWVGPSVTPLTNLNSGFRMYEVDTGDFNVYNAYTWYADVHSFPNLTSTGPTFQFEYNTRETYGPAINWPEEAPLNATFWHRVTEAMETNRSLVETFNTFQGKSSIQSPNCTNDACAAAKVCYIRSGDTAVAQKCIPGYGSVQSKYPS